MNRIQGNYLAVLSLLHIRCDEERQKSIPRQDFKHFLLNLSPKVKKSLGLDLKPSGIDTILDQLLKKELITSSSMNTTNKNAKHQVQYALNENALKIIQGFADLLTQNQKILLKNSKNENLE